MRRSGANLGGVVGSGLLCCLLLLGACGGSDNDAESTVRVSVIASSASGNHVAGGRFDATAPPLMFAGPADPKWVTVANDRGTPFVVVVTESGAVAGFRIEAGGAEPAEINIDALPPGTPPTVLEGAGGVLVLAPPATSGSFLSHPLALPGGGLAFIDDSGGVVVSGAAGNRRFDVDALLDARPVLSADGLIAVYAGPTAEYGHGVLGDQIEASEIHVIDPDLLESVLTIQAPPGEVFEGLSPIWADTDGDDLDELLATLSGPEEGARLVVFSESGRLQATSDPVGQGFRWRHQLAVGEFGPDGGIEIVDVRTPHIGGRLEFFAVAAPRLAGVVAPGDFSTHRIGSRNLDQAVAVTAGPGSQLSIIVPSQDQRTLHIARRVDDGVEVQVLLELSSGLATNISGAAVAESAVVVAALSDGTVLVWG